jgi:CBS domain containing-hemolysin-like protein
MKLVVEVGRTRLPVYENSLDSIVGILYVKDLLGVPSDGEVLKAPLRSLLREPWFVPTTKPVDDLLREFRRTRSHMAIVVDEYGATAGVVTIEDALEEIVGDIVDESDKEEDVDLVQVDDATLEADGRVHIDELNEMFGLELPESDEFDTLGGFIIHQLGSIPAVAEVVHWRQYKLTVLKANRRRIERVRLEILEEPHNRSA